MNTYFKKKHYWVFLGPVLQPGAQAHCGDAYIGTTCPHLTDENMESQREEMTMPRSHNHLEAKPYLNPHGPSMLRAVHSEGGPGGWHGQSLVQNQHGKLLETFSQSL